MRKPLVPLAVLATASLAIACGDDGGAGETGPEEDTIHVADAWAYSPMRDVGALYFRAHNGAKQDDRLIGVSSPIAGRAEIRETVEQDGQTVARPVEGVTIGFDEEVAFEPGWYHVVLLDLTEPLEIDSTITVVLEFASAGEIQVRALVKAFVPMGGPDLGDKGMTGPTGVTAPADMG